MKVTLKNKKKLNSEIKFNLEGLIVLDYDQLLQVNGAGGSGSAGGGGSSSGPSGGIPVKPSEVDLDANVNKAKDLSAIEFYNAVKNKGEWDYKQKGSEYQDFGNFNYGVTGKAAGIPDQVLLRGAGWAQEQAGTSQSNWGHWWGSSPYGDDPQDQAQIQAGINYYNETYKHK